MSHGEDHELQVELGMALKSDLSLTPDQQQISSLAQSATDHCQALQDATVGPIAEAIEWETRKPESDKYNVPHEVHDTGTVGKFECKSILSFNSDLNIYDKLIK